MRIKFSDYLPKNVVFHPAKDYILFDFSVDKNYYFYYVFPEWLYSLWYQPGKQQNTTKVRFFMSFAFHYSEKTLSVRMVLLLCTFCMVSFYNPSTLQSSPPAGGSMDKANRLIHEQSPYLLQHAHNPVDWYPWGKEAFARAKKEDKPIFLSIGYSTCHWCHVMAHESFENPAIAAILNKWFICIKVDREERPDIDQMYIAATQALNGSGGWPMSVFLFPDGRPFWAATYIPPKGQYGRPGFSEILNAVHTAWTTRRDELADSAAGLIDALEGAHRRPANAVQDNAAQRAYSSLRTSFDDQYGGFGNAPKFPRPVIYSFLFGYWRETGDEKARDMALATLQAMARGGMYDQLGGGFHRYSVDEQWRVPHFEKMLYDQAQLADAYLDAYQITGEARYAEVARQILNYVLRDMRDPAGGFYSAEDADSDDPYTAAEHGEGAFYLWTEKDIVQTVGAADADIFNYCYGVKFDGNALSDPQQEFTGRNILFRLHTTADAAAHFSTDTQHIEAALDRARQKLSAKRQLRKRPHLDDKVLTAWNGLMIGALARGGAILQEPEFTKAAVQTASFIRVKLYDPQTKKLQRRYRQGQSGLAGQLDDYAYLTAGLIELYQVVQEPEWLQWAIDLTRSQTKLFADSGTDGFFDSLQDPTVVVRMKGDYDGAEPAANSIAAQNLVRLGRLTGKNKWLALAEKTINSFSSQINTYPQALARMLDVRRELSEKPRQVVIAGRRGAEDTRAMMDAVFSVYDPGRMLLLADGAENQKFSGKMLPFIRTAVMQKNTVTAYVCKDFTCQLPVTTVEELQVELGKESTL